MKGKKQKKSSFYKGEYPTFTLEAPPDAPEGAEYIEQLKAFKLKDLKIFNIEDLKETFSYDTPDISQADIEMVYPSFVLDFSESIPWLVFFISQGTDLCMEIYIKPRASTGWVALSIEGFNSLDVLKIPCEMDAIEVFKKVGNRLRFSHSASLIDKIVKSQQLSDFLNIAAIVIYQKVFMLLNCSNVEVVPVRQRVRPSAKAKKTSIISHKLQVKKRVYKSPSKGGSHSTPRRHSVRGHVRRMKNGIKIWIHPYVRGEGPGAVEKSYIL
jgi:hypothetical protein